MTYPDMFARCVDKAPLATTARLLLERSFDPQVLDDLFERVADEQYTRNLLFSDVVGLVASVVQRMHPSIHAAYHNELYKPVCALSTLYDKLNGIEPAVSAALVADNARRMREVITQLQAQLPPLIPNYSTRIVDGNALAATDHRLKVLRETRGGPLPGKSLAVLDYEYDLLTNLIPCEDGHAQERSLSDALLALVEKGQVWMADRNFCTKKILSGIVARGGDFLIREHRKLPLFEETPLQTISSEKKTIIQEQRVILETENGNITMRRILLKLPRPTRDGDREIVILTTLAEEIASPAFLLETYRKRWRIESMFADLTTALRCEISGLGQPRAALFAFATAVVAANTLGTIRALLRGIHGEQVEETVSVYHLVNDLKNSYASVEFVEDEIAWPSYVDQPIAEFVDLLKDVAGHMDLRRYPKAKKRPSKARRTQRGSPSDPPHVSTYQLLQGAKQKKLDSSAKVTRK